MAAAGGPAGEHGVPPHSRERGPYGVRRDDRHLRRPQVLPCRREPRRRPSPPPFRQDDPVGARHDSRPRRGSGPRLGRGSRRHARPEAGSVHRHDRVERGRPAQGGQAFRRLTGPSGPPHAGGPERRYRLVRVMMVIVSLPHVWPHDRWAAAKASSSVSAGRCSSALMSLSTASPPGCGHCDGMAAVAIAVAAGGCPARRVSAWPALTSLLL
ncbi:hypothetical protein SBRY_100161 [Actinacidiphila bryophytorum]|uniref:Uncharacterized protein n=1 Tax=Actinacidiphila bryophytorum TaxID=1436133 RepID=A0A9W4E544_9ACTN|nr:hypothetical protein SBRY_100161 [Actinacidiphila bryophytorum]